MSTLVLVVTRRCNQRCAYCPVVKDDRSGMTRADVHAAFDSLVGSLGITRVKLFGGEPLLAPEAVLSALDEASARPGIERVTVCTNGALLDGGWLDRLEVNPKAWLTLSLDGHDADHAALRRPAPGQPDGLGAIARLLPRLVRLGRVTVTQVIPPQTAERAGLNFRHLLELGFTRINILPASYLPWTRTELGALRTGLYDVAAAVREAWCGGKRLRLVNLTTRTPQPTFSNGVVVDVDGRVFPNDCILSRLPAGARERFCCGSVSSPPSRADLARAGARCAAELGCAQSTEVLRSTQVADQLLDAFCRSLLPDLLALRTSRVAATRAGLRPDAADLPLHAFSRPNVGTGPVPEVWS